MKVEVERLENSRCRIKCEAAAEEVDRVFRSQAWDISSARSIPGFRPGKAPVEVVESRFGEQLREGVRAALVEQGYRQGVAQGELEPLAPPVSEVLPEPRRGNPYSFSLLVDVRPRIELGDYKSLRVTVKPAEVTEEHVDAAIERLRQESAEYRPIPPRPVEKGDWVLVDFRSSLGGQPLQEMEAFLFRVGAGVFPEAVEEALLGKSPGETVEVDVPSEGEGAGPLSFTVKVRELKERVVPPLDDDFARSFIGAESLSRMREEVRRRLAVAAREEARAQAHSEAVDKLIEMAKMEVPAGLVERQLEYLLAVVQNDPRLAAGRTEEELARELRPVAVRQVQASLIIEEIARREGVSVTDGELREAAAAVLARLPDDEERRRWLEGGGLSELHYRLLRRKVLEMFTPAEPQRLIVTPDEAGRGGPGGIVTP